MIVVFVFFLSRKISTVRDTFLRSSALVSSYLNAHCTLFDFQCILTREEEKLKHTHTLSKDLILYTLTCTRSVTYKQSSEREAKGAMLPIKCTWNAPPTFANFFSRAMYPQCGFLTSVCVYTIAPPEGRGFLQNSCEILQ